ncbi:MAG: HD domain-containing protein [Oscillospiraceae bacterium]|nr:HD domain-containing protein [Oscillospiraceae bacterium]
MKQHYFVKKKEEHHMNVIMHNGYDALHAIFNHLPEHIIRHSRRVAVLAAVLAAYVPEEQLPEEIDMKTYHIALSYAGRYHEIGIYLARNDIKQRPVMAEKVLNEYWNMDFAPQFNEIVFEAVRGCHERFDGTGYPNKLHGDEIPLSAQLVGLADMLDDMVHYRSGRFSHGNIARRAMQAAKILEKKEDLFGPKAMACFEQVQDEIFALYLNYHWEYEHSFA